MNVLVEERKEQQLPSAQLGSYAPFSGVKYYTILDEQDVAEGKNKIDTIGWRRSRSSVEIVSKATDRKPNSMGRRMREVDIFYALSERQINKMISAGRSLSIPAGGEIGVAGDRRNHIFVIIEGKAELSAETAIGAITVRIAGPGETFPLAVLIGAGTLITSATAMTDMELVAIPRSKILALCSEDTEIGMRIYAAIADLLGARYQSTLERLTSSTEQALKKSGYFVNV